MTDVADRPLRADAARNAERLLRAAREVYGELGPDAPIEAIARRAGVGERTLYRRFPTKGDLISAALDEALSELARRGQETGVVRADLVAEDLPRLIAMLYGVLFTMDSTTDGWRRYVALVLDSISTGPRRRLPRAAPLRFAPAASTWL